MKPPVKPPVQQEQEAAARERPFRVFGAGPGWRGALREFAIIVAGVLAALAAQALWEGHQERDRERGYLEQLLTDTRENEARLQMAFSEDSANRVGARRLIEALTTTSAVSPDSFLVWMGATGSASEFRAVSGSYDALLLSGDLRLIRDDTLRALIPQYAASLEAETQRLAQLRALLLDAVGDMGREMPFARRVFIAGLNVSAEDIEQVRRSDEAVGILFTLHAANENRMNNFRSMLCQTVRLREALERATGEVPAPSPAPGEDSAQSRATGARPT